MKLAFPYLNHHAHTFADVENTCEREKIDLKLGKHTPDVLGYIVRTRDPVPKHTIVINSSLDEIARTFVGFHELGHYIMHVPITSKQYLYCQRNAERTRSKHECEADSFALVAMIPLHLLKELAATGYEDLHPALAELCVRRWKIWEHHGL